MKNWLYLALSNNWKKKIISFMFAVIVWFLVSQAVTMTKVISNVSIRVVNLPMNQTVVGLLPNGLLNRTTSVTITGRKNIMNNLSSSDFEVVVNAAGRYESWMERVDKRNLVKINQELDFSANLVKVAGNDVFINLSKLITEDIVVTIAPPIGFSPKGYQYLEVWPKFLIQQVTGPKEQVLALKDRGLEVVFDLNNVSQQDLDALYDHENKRDDLAFMVPDSWKKVSIPFEDNSMKLLNDPRALSLHILFMKQHLIVIKKKLPIMIFYPNNSSGGLNPLDIAIAEDGIVSSNNGIPYLNIPLFVKDVSRLFLDIVKDHIALAVIVNPTNQNVVEWAIEFMNEKNLENYYVNKVREHNNKDFRADDERTDHVIRQRFRDYLRDMTIFDEQGNPLQLNIYLKNSYIHINKS